MSLKRGFKAEANRISIRWRQNLGLRPEAPIDLEALAARLSLPIMPLSSFRGECPGAVLQLFRTDPGAFSAVTIQCGPTRRVVIYNDAHSKGRQRSDIAHEIAHVLLGHDFTLPIDNSGCRNVDRDIEDEANWLGSILLIPDAAAMNIVRTGMDEESACKIYGVSKPMLRMRINTSGARIRIGRLYH